MGLSCTRTWNIVLDKNGIFLVFSMMLGATARYKENAELERGA